MGENEWKVQLGVDIDVSDLQSRINKAGDKVTPIPIKVEIENLNEIKKQLQNLGGTKGNSKVAIPIDTASVEGALKEVSASIKEIKTAIGTLDSKSGMKSLLSSINQISSALDKASDKFVELNSNLSALANKDFNINFGINMGKSAAQRASEQGDAKRDAISQLKQQAEALEDYLDQYYKVTQKGEGIAKLTQGTSLFGKFWEMSPNIGDTNKSLKEQVVIYKQYIDLIQKAAKVKGVDLSDVASGFSKTTDEIEKEVRSVESGAKEAEEQFKKLKGIFGGIDTEGLGQALEPIIKDLGEIKKALTDLSAETPLNQLKTSFDQLSNSITQLIQNCDKIKISLNDVGSAGANLGANVGNELANGFNNSMESVQASAAETSGVITDLKKTLETMRLDRSSIDAITKDIEDLGFEATKASVKMRDGNFDITVQGVDSLGRAVTEIRHLNSATNEITGVSRTISQTLKDSDVFVNKQKRAVADLTNQIDQLNRAAIDQNAARPIKDSAHLTSLKTKYDEIISAIERMGAASSDTFEDERNKVRTLIGEYKSLKSEYKNAENVALQMDGNDFASGLEIAKNKLAEFKAQAQGFPQLTQTIKDLDKAIEGVGDVASLKEFNNQLRVARSELSKVKTETSNIGEIRFRLADTGFDGFEQEVARARAAVEALKAPSDELRDALKQLDTAMDAMNTADEANDIQKLRLAYKDYEIALKQVDSQLKLHQQTENNATKEASFEAAKAGALLRLKGLFSENSQAAKIFGAELERLQRELDECGDTKGLQRINREIRNLGQEVKNANVKTQTFSERFKKQWEQYTSYFSVASVFSYAYQGLRDMFQEVVAIDTAMTELKKVTDETDASYNKFLSNAAKRSKELGTTIDGLVESTADFARLGYGFEDSQKLAEVANIYAVVGDEIEGVEDATQSLVSTMAAFKDEMNGLDDSEFALSIVDKMNEVDILAS